MDVDTERQDPHYNYVTGFGSLASFMASDADHAPLVFRRFDKLAARDLVYYQSQLSQLQAEQDELDIQDRKEVDSMENGMDRRRKDHVDLIRDCARDWRIFEDALAHPTLSVQGSATGTAYASRKKRVDIAIKIRTTLKDYREAIIQQSTLLSMPTPSQQNMTTISCFFHGNKQTPLDFDTGAAFYPVLSGASNSLYPPNTSTSNIRDLDYISLSKPLEQDRLTKFLRTRPLSRLFRTKPPSILPTISHQSSPQVRHYSNECIKFAASFIANHTAAVLLFVLIFALSKTSASHRALTLGLIAMFTVVFAVSLALMTTASRSEIFGACAAYSAVLVVFVSGDFAASSGSS